MAYSTKKDGRDYLVVVTETGEEKHRYHPPNAKKQADAQCKKLSDAEGFGNPDKVSYLSDGTRVNIQYKNKEKYRGPNS